jgi:hypothetical protein
MVSVPEDGSPLFIQKKIPVHGSQLKQITSMIQSQGNPDIQLSFYT